MTYQLSRVQPELAPKIWPHIESFVEKALKRGHALSKSLPTDILGHIIFRRMDLWIVHDGKNIDACVVSKFLDWDRSRTLYVPIIGGKNLKAWGEMVNQELYNFAKANGCKTLGGELRKGWASMPGWKVTGVTLEREIE